MSLVSMIGIRRENNACAFSLFLLQCNLHISMNVTVTPNTEKSEVTLDVTVPVQDFKLYIDRAARRLTTDKPLKGFRPGKAPFDVVVSTFGQDRVLHEAMDLALPKFFVQALLDHSIEAITRPSITVKELALDKDFVFSATVAVLPDVTVGDPTTLTITKQVVDVTPEEIEKELKYLARMRSTFIDMARPAETGDTVTMDFTIKHDGKLLDGGASTNQTVTIGEGHFLPEFEQKITGINVGDEREFTLTLPSDFRDETLRGKMVTAQVKAHRIQKRVIPEITDEFVKKLGSFENVEDLKNKLQTGIRQEKQQKERERQRVEISEQLAEKSTFGFIPDVLIQREIDNRIAELQQFLAMRSKTMEDYLKETNKTQEHLRKEMEEGAVKHIKVGLALRSFADAENIVISDDDIQKEIATYLSRYPSVEEAKKQIDVDKLKENIHSHLRTQRALDSLEKKVQFTDVSPEKKDKK